MVQKRKVSLLVLVSEHWPWLAFVVVPAVVFAAPWLYRLIFAPDGTNWQDRAAAFAPVESLFNGLAFAGLLVALAYQRAEAKRQRKELRLQRKQLALQLREHADSRDVMKQQRDEFEQQVQAMNRQRLETTLFSTLELFSKVSDSVSYYDQSGNKAFARFRAEVRGLGHGTGAISFQSWRELGRALVFRVTPSLDSSFFSYLSTLSVLLELIDRETIQEDDRQFYLRLIRSRLSQEQLFFLHYVAITPRCSYVLRTLLEKHLLFADLQPEFLLHAEHVGWRVRLGEYANCVATLQPI